MKSLTDILNWKLLDGSHEWPGPDGGTCINEAAIVVAGLEYRSVSGADDLPPCFSLVIGSYLIRLNDNLDDHARQRLIEFVPRLSGSADTPAVEQQRLEFIVIETVKRIVANAMSAAGLPEQAQQCRDVRMIDDAKVAAAEAAEAAGAARDAWAAGTARAAEAAGAAGAAWDERAEEAAWAAWAAIDDDAIAIVRGALAIGNQAPAIDVALIEQRVAAAKQREAAL